MSRRFYCAVTGRTFSPASRTSRFLIVCGLGRHKNWPEEWCRPSSEISSVQGDSGSSPSSHLGKEAWQVKLGQGGCASTASALSWNGNVQESTMPRNRLGHHYHFSTVDVCAGGCSSILLHLLGRQGGGATGQGHPVLF